MDTVLIVLLCFAFLYLMYAIGFGILRRRMVAQARELMRSLAGERVDMACADAGYLGQESEGLEQKRGHGTLLLTDKEVYFESTRPVRKWIIPLTSVTGVEVVKSHLNRLSSKPLLKVLYTNEQGQPDSIAWKVPNPDEWTKRMAEIVNRKEEPIDLPSER